MSIKENLQIIREKSYNAAVKAGRNADDIKLMAVSKFHPAESILEAVENSQFLFGENRVQEAMTKFPDIVSTHSEVNLHIIGTLQTNKVKNAITIASCIQSVDSLHLAQEIEKQCSKINKNIDVLFEIHTAEDSKSGFSDLNELYNVLSLIAENKFEHIVPKGLMTMAPFINDEKQIRKSFIKVRKLSEKLKIDFPMFDFSELSMGMSGDFEVAIEEGSTLIRVGTAIFGERQY